MRTDEFTTHKCEVCKKNRSIHKVHPIQADLKERVSWICRTCILEKIILLVRAWNCPSRDIYDLYNRPIYSLSIARLGSVQDVLDGWDEYEIDEEFLGTGRPEENSNTDKKWVALSEGARKSGLLSYT